MAHIKFISPQGWDFDLASAATIKVASTGLRGTDRSDFIKRASGAENLFLPYLDQVKIAADELPVHVIGLGAVESWGPNRNGDGFRKKALQQYHKTFEKSAKFYRNHKNKDPKISYGVIKLAVYNEKMARVELLCALNKTKEAAERNGGLIADREMEKLANKNASLAVSMACRIPYDNCSYCNNQARTRDEYCKAAQCAAGGCAENLTRVVKVGNDSHHLFVHNDHPHFFDMSDVFRPADRTAHGGLADYLQKAASDGYEYRPDIDLISVFDVVSPINVVLDQTPAKYHNAVKIAYACMDMSNLDDETPEGIRLALAVNGAEVRPMPEVKVAGFLGELAQHKVILPLREYARLGQREHLVKDAKTQIKAATHRLISNGLLDRYFEDPRFDLTQTPTEYVKQAAAQYVDSYSLDLPRLQHREIVARLRGVELPISAYSNTKEASEVSSESRILAEDYAAYRALALDQISRFDSKFPLTAWASECQNRGS